MESKSIYTILLSIIAVLTLALAVLIIFLFISYNPNQQAVNNADTVKGMSERVVPDDEMIEFKLFNGEEKMFALKGEPENPDSIVMVSVTIKCDAGKKRRKEADITSLVEQYMSELEEAVGDYYANITLTEAKLLEIRYKARDDLLEIFNEILNRNKQEKPDFIPSGKTAIPKHFSSYITGQRDRGTVLLSLRVRLLTDFHNNFRFRRDSGTVPVSLSRVPLF